MDEAIDLLTLIKKNNDAIYNNCFESVSFLYQLIPSISLNEEYNNLIVYHFHNYFRNMQKGDDFMAKYPIIGNVRLYANLNIQINNAMLLFAYISESSEMIKHIITLIQEKYPTLNILSQKIFYIDGINVDDDCIITSEQLIMDNDYASNIRITTKQLDMINSMLKAKFSDLIK